MSTWRKWPAVQRPRPRRSRPSSTRFLEIKRQHRGHPDCGWPRFSLSQFISPPRAGGARGGGNQMKQRQMASILVVAVVLVILPLCAVADQCIEGDCVNGKG